MKKGFVHLGRYSELDSKKDRWLYRFFEILPGLLSWGTLFGIVFLSRFKPVWIAFFIIVFDLYWLIRAVYFLFFLHSTYKRLEKNKARDWLKKLKKLGSDNHSLDVESYEDLYHLMIYPAYKESYELIAESLQELAESNYPMENVFAVVGLEERRGKEEIARLKEKLEEEFGDKFAEFLITVHPRDIPGEMAGKGSNETWAAKRAKEKLIDKKGLDYERVIVSSFDVDTQVPAGYLGRLTYAYLTTDDPTRTSFQPIPLYHNNIWEAPALARVISYSTTFWFMFLQQRPEREGTFSSHSMSFKALDEVGYWQTNIVTEDARIFFQCLLYYDGDYKVKSLYYPVSMDANVSWTFWRTVKAQYKQQRRWSWGVEHVPYLLYNFFRNKKISLRKKLYYIFILGESFYSWATTSILIFLLGWLPLILGGAVFNSTVVAFRLPRLTSILMTVAMLGIMFSAYVGIRIAPKPPKKRKTGKILLFFQWILLPLSLIIFGAFPALESQTRLMINKPLGFWPTEKVRKDSKS